MKREVRGLHGSEAEIIEFDEDQPTVRSYRVIPSRPDPLAGLPGWITWPMFVALVSVCLVGLAGGLYLVGMGLFLLWTALH